MKKKSLSIKKGMRKLAAIAMATTMLISTAAMSFATDGIDYSQWDSLPIYPADVMNTQLLTPVKYFMDKGIVEGADDGLFHPELSITRAEFATIMAKATNSSTASSGNTVAIEFTDLTGYEWASEYIYACVDAGLMKGTGETTFSPAGNVTYAELVTVIQRSQGAGGDLDLAGTWPYNYIEQAQRRNFMGATMVTNWFDSATRGDVITVMYNTIGEEDIAELSGIDVTIAGAASGAAMAPVFKWSTYEYTVTVPANAVSVDITAHADSVTDIEIDGIFRETANILLTVQEKEVDITASSWGRDDATYTVTIVKEVPTPAPAP